ncbi:hypothetical protein ACLOJK_014817 [Asimina triloba]
MVVMMEHRNMCFDGQARQDLRVREAGYDDTWQLQLEIGQMRRSLCVEEAGDDDTRQLRLEI